MLHGIGVQNVLAKDGIDPVVANGHVVVDVVVPGHAVITVDSIIPSSDIPFADRAGMVVAVVVAVVAGRRRRTAGRRRGGSTSQQRCRCCCCCLWKETARRLSQ